MAPRWRVEDATLLASARAALPRLRVHPTAVYEHKHPLTRRLAAGPVAHGAVDVEIDDQVVTLVHRGTNVVDRVFRFPERVLDAVWTRFKHADAAYLCVLTRSDVARLYAPDGEVFDVALPFPADRIVALPLDAGGGLLLQRRPVASSIPTAAATAAAYSPSSASTRRSISPGKPPIATLPSTTTSSATPSQPRFFTLAHPLEEVKPVAVTGARASGDASKPAFVSDPALDLVDVCVFPDRLDGVRTLVVCFHRQDNRFFVYELMAYRPPKPIAIAAFPPTPIQHGQVFPPMTTPPPLLKISQAYQPHTPSSSPSPWVSPAKFRQQQREQAMMEHFLRSHIVPELSLQPLWTSPSLDALTGSHRGKRPRDILTKLTESVLQSTKSYTAFVVNGDHGEHLLCVMDEKAGALLMIPTSALLGTRQDEETVRIVKCRQAIPVSVSQDRHGRVKTSTDLVVCSDGGRLELYSLGEPVAQLGLPAQAANMQVTRITQIGADDSFTILFSNSSSAWRCSHPLQNTSSSLLASVFDIMEFTMPPQDYVKIRVATAAASAKVAEEESNLSSLSMGAGEWSALKSIIYASTDVAVVGQQNASEPDGAPSTSEDEGDALYERMMQSDFASLYRHENSVLCAVLGGDAIESSALPSSDELLKPPQVSISVKVLLETLTALHLLHEDLRLSVSRSSDAVKLSAFLEQWSGAHFGLQRLSMYYHNQSVVLDPAYQDNSSTADERLLDEAVNAIRQFSETNVPNIYEWVRIRIQGDDFVEEFPHIQGWSAMHLRENPLWRTEAVCRAFTLLLECDGDMDITTGVSAPLTGLMEYLASDPVGKRLVLCDLPLGIRLPILEAIRMYRENPPPTVSGDICGFIGRIDLSGSLSLAETCGPSPSVVDQRVLNKPGASTATANGNPDDSLHRSEVSDGLSDVVYQSQRLFPQDQRMKEVARLLRSSRPICLRLEKTSDMSDQDYILQQQTRLLLLCKRSMALPVARGMLTLGTFDPSGIQNQAWQLSIPALPLAGRTPPTNAIVSLDVSGYAKELTYWPQFHNGCATGLRLPDQDLSGIVNRYWIKYHRPSAAEFQRLARQNANGAQAQPPGSSARDIDEAYAAHAGLLLGLGLKGHLKYLSMADVYNYLSLSNEFITVAILLGMATTAAHSRRERDTPKEGDDTNQESTESRRTSIDPLLAPNSTEVPMSQGVTEPEEAILGRSGLGEPSDNLKTAPIAGVGLEMSLERSVSKMLCLHIPSLLPPPFAEFSVPASTQTAALLGLGILYEGSGHRLMTELLLTEITRSPTSTQFTSAQTTTTPSSTSTPYDQLEGYSLAAGLALGLVVLGRGRVTGGDPGLDDLGLEEKLYKYMVGGAQQQSNTDSSTGGSSASGNCLYRGRRWKPFGSSDSGHRMNSGSNGASHGMHGRESKHAQDRSGRGGEHVNIVVTACGSALALGFMYMKTGNRSIAAQLAVPDTLILLDYVRPDILMMRVLAKNLVMWDAIQPTTAWIEKSEVPAQLLQAYRSIRHQDLDSTENPIMLPDHADIRSICESYANIVTGACFSMGLRYAGTADAHAREAIRHFVLHFREMRSKSALLGGDIVAAATERATIERCLAVCSQALALVDAGTGNIETLTLLRSINLRQRVDSELTYGNHMALSMSIGLLLLGGGRLTVSRSKRAIAALIISLYPMTAMNTADNKHHLQAFRHLYVLAVDSTRLVETIDTHTNSNVSVSLRVQLRREEQNAGPIIPVLKEEAWIERTFVTPCLLPDLDTISWIAIDAPEYYPVDIHLPHTGALQAWQARKAKNTANDLRIGLLLDKNTILLQRRRHRCQTHLAVLEGTDKTSSAARSERGSLLSLHSKYFDASGKEGFLESTSDYWWQQQQEHLQELIALGDGDNERGWYLQTFAGALYAVWHLGHPRLSLSTVDGIWNLKLMEEFYRLEPLKSREKRRSVVQESDNNESEDTSEDVTQREFANWLRDQTELSLRQLWRLETAIPIPSLTAAREVLLGSWSKYESASPEAFLVSALFQYLDAPRSIQSDLTGWTERMRVALNESTHMTTRASMPDLAVNFAIDEFLLAPKIRLTQEERTFWLRLVSFFLFAV
ncbi:hypothetical protein Poli38472_006118 [Pythium oligandrum]|uniref:Anaphase-promoting complex subunit 1 N-terminal domain-containing protein n=1 Tax=Pythium oligandrum TaxID=41045 RepID=A0A8K1CSB6_PYTOL|nr:hypothetical protein Poli38472_006118 [Pythium oligandrum]|eukprot:TMW68650.1 hypothetical protein Poli38472_006118 [Pythium oligandrum]